MQVEEIELDHPFGVAVDASSLVYVSEKNNHRISVFTSEGKFVTLFGRNGKDCLIIPLDLAVDYSVVYSRNNRVQIF